MIHPAARLLASLLALAPAIARAQNDAPGASPPGPAASLPPVPRPASPAGEILTKASEAIRDLSSLSFNVSMRGEGLLAAYAPTLSARVVAARSPANPALWRVRITGSGRLQPDRPEVSFDASFQDHFVEWVEPAERKVLRRPLKPTPRSDSLRHAQQLRLDWLFGSPAFSRELGVAVSGSVLEDAQVDGRSCHVVEVAVTGASGGKRRIALAIDDGIVRRYEMLVTGQFEGSTIFDITSVDAFTTIDPAATRVPVPDGFDAEPEPPPPPPDPTAPAAATPTPAAAPATPPAQTRPEPPRPAPAFELKTAAGEIVTLDSLRGKPALLFFWGTWSLPSQDAIAPLAALRARFEPDGLTILGLSVRERNPQAGADYLQRENAGFSTLLNADAAAEAFNVRVYPTFILLDAECRILHTIEGFPLNATLDDLAARIEALLRPSTGST